MAINVVFTALVVVEAPMEMELKQFELIVKVATLDTNHGLYFVRWKANSTDNNCVTIVAYVESLRHVVVDKLEWA